MAELTVWFERLPDDDHQTLGWQLSVVLSGPPAGRSLFSDRRMMWVEERWPWL